MRTCLYLSDPSSAPVLGQFAREANACVRIAHMASILGYETCLLILCCECMQLVAVLRSASWPAALSVLADLV